MLRTWPRVAPGNSLLSELRACAQPLRLYSSIRSRDELAGRDRGFPSFRPRDRNPHRRAGASDRAEAGGWVGALSGKTISGDLLQYGWFFQISGTKSSARNQLTANRTAISPTPQKNSRTGSV